jgi:hypothetical protein
VGQTIRTCDFPLHLGQFALRPWTLEWVDAGKNAAAQVGPEFDESTGGRIMRAADVMVTDVVAVHPDASVRKSQDFFLAHRISGFRSSTGLAGWSES